MQTLFLLTARAWGIPQPEERVQEAASDLEELMRHLRVIMEYPLPLDVEPASGLSMEALAAEQGRKGGGALGDGGQW